MCVVIYLYINEWETDKNTNQTHGGVMLSEKTITN
jgi:hypothetical protein